MYLRLIQRRLPIDRFVKICYRKSFVFFLLFCNFFICLIFASLHHCKPQKEESKIIHLNGFAFGTNVNIKIDKGIASCNVLCFDLLSQKIDSVLKKIDKSASNWRDDSEIARLNKHHSRKPFSVSSNLWEIIQEAQSVYALTNGAFDPARAELFSLWGFVGHNSSKAKAPSQREIQSVLTKSSMILLQSSIIQSKSNQKRQYSIQKRKLSIQLNLSALAKGYAVDQIAEMLHRDGFRSFMVEIGGEVRLGQEKSNGQLWQIAIEKPHFGGKRSIFRIAKLKNQALATSGNYRNYFIDSKSGQLYSHILDPRTGYPVKGRTLSATVVGPHCMRADALATALMVLSVEDGKKLIESLSDYEALWILRKNNNEAKKEKFQAYLSSQMGSYLE